MSEVKNPIGTRHSASNNPEVLNERAQQLKTSRSGYVGSLTKYINRISVQISSTGNRIEVERLLGKISGTFTKIVQLTFEYVKIVDPLEIDRAESLLAEQKVKVQQIQKLCDEYL